MIGPTSGVAKVGPYSFPRSGQYFSGRKFIQPTTQDTIAVKFRRSGASSTGASFSALLPDRATNAWSVGASTDDVSSLSSLGRVVRFVDSLANAFSPRVARTSWRFWSRRLPRRRWPLRECRPPTGQEGSKIGKSDSPECQTGPSDFSKGNNNL
jgi:hypothetical protein